ncbi:MAG TPA: hypothetical protein VL442_00675 [Mucilaginibacter sp.]|jgi:hypothetical protein|nr:hypothetical protein [Mucilaginibacter sp.]
MKTNPKEPTAVWIIIIIAMTLIAALIFFDAKMIGTCKARAKALQDSIRTNREYYPDSALDEDTTFIEDPADTNHSELKWEELRDGRR